jgi:hypothetical protein
MQDPLKYASLCNRIHKTFNNENDRQHFLEQNLNKFMDKAKKCVEDN